MLVAVLEVDVGAQLLQDDEGDEALRHAEVQGRVALDLGEDRALLVDEVHRFEDLLQALVPVERRSLVIINILIPAVEAVVDVAFLMQRLNQRERFLLRFQRLYRRIVLLHEPVVLQLKVPHLGLALLARDQVLGKLDEVLSRLFEVF